MLLSPIKNTVLVFAQNGQVQHRFCAERDASHELESIKADGCPAAVVVCDGADAETHFHVNPQFRGHVLFVEARLRLDLQMDPCHRTFH